ncbi:hypothetical protein E1B28_013861 [Marasmius oreades]|uniref:Uncharacterized protein n=1 Tax=Marasmius oreades TaxID=181124 RepID=A0A9P7ULK0_9AGAR|nr:uncharacterized protein E1B28_013861 [Marasmius oreades]KAG7085321.1 hypothetical protein E1B28_013861 [Marasmius oreades]
MTSFFQESHHINFSGNQSFTNARTIVNNFHPIYPAVPHTDSDSDLSDKERTTLSTLGDEEKRLNLAKKHGFRSIKIGDIIVEREVSSNVLEVSVKRPTGSVLKTTNPFQNRVNSQVTTSVKIRRRVQDARIIKFKDQTFTVVTFEPEDGTDDDGVEGVWKRVYEASSSQRREILPQLFGVGRSPTPMLIYHDASLGGQTVKAQFMAKAPIVWSYLWYKLTCSEYAMTADGDMRRLLKDVTTINAEEWVFNFRTGSWQYDLTSFIAQCDPSFNLGNHMILPDVLLINQLRGNLPLESKMIVDGLQQDFLRLIASIGAMRPVGDKDFSYHTLLTFGAVIDPEKPGILAHLPSISSPQWYHRLSEHGLKAKVRISQSVPGRVDLKFEKGVNMVQLELGLEIPPDKREQSRIAYIIQSLGLCKKFGRARDTWKNLVFVHEFLFILTGTVTSEFIHRTAGAYLFMTPVFSILERINGMPCIQWPLRAPLYHWSSDPEGKILVPKEDWERVGIPELELQVYVGSFWDTDEYAAMQEYLTIQGYDYYGDQLARAQGYQSMNRWDPHTTTQVRLEDAEDWVRLEDGQQAITERERDPNGITSPSMYSLISGPRLTSVAEEPVLGEVSASSEGGNFVGWLQKGWLNRRAPGKIGILKAASK